MSKPERAPPKLKETSVEVLDLFRNGMKVQDIADKMGMKNPRVYGIIWRARKRGEMLTAREEMSPEKRMYASLKRKIFPMGAPKEAISNGMTEEVFNHMIRQMEKGGYKSYMEYFVDLAVDAYYAHLESNNDDK